MMSTHQIYISYQIGFLPSIGSIDRGRFDWLAARQLVDNHLNMQKSRAAFSSVWRSLYAWLSNTFAWIELKFSSAEMVG